jgi:hypothetical protein
MSADDLTLRCSECGQEFVFTAMDQQYFQERGYSSPKRCKRCRQAKQSAGSYGQQDSGRGAGYNRGTGTETTVVCASCGQTTTVPFEPRGIGRFTVRTATSQSKVHEVVVPATEEIATGIAAATDLLFACRATGCSGADSRFAVSFSASPIGFRFARMA